MLKFKWIFAVVVFVTFGQAAWGLTCSHVQDSIEFSLGGESPGRLRGRLRVNHVDVGVPAIGLNQFLNAQNSSLVVSGNEVVVEGASAQFTFKGSATRQGGVYMGHFSISVRTDAGEFSLEDAPLICN